MDQWAQYRGFLRNEFPWFGLCRLLARSRPAACSLNVQCIDARIGEWSLGERICGCALLPSSDQKRWRYRLTQRAACIGDGGAGRARRYRNLLQTGPSGSTRQTHPRAAFIRKAVLEFPEHRLPIREPSLAGHLNIQIMDTLVGEYDVSEQVLAIDIGIHSNRLRFELEHDSRRPIQTAHARWRRRVVGRAAVVPALARHPPR